jgi:hypothetical protein
LSVPNIPSAFGTDPIAVLRIEDVGRGGRVTGLVLVHTDGVVTGPEAGMKSLRRLPFAVVMQPAEVGDGHDAAVSMNGSPVGCIELQRLMTPPFVSIRHVVA